MRAPSVLITTRAADSAAWMRSDLLVRLAPFALVVAATQARHRRLHPLPPPRRLGVARRGGDGAGRPAARAGLLAPARPALDPGREPGPLRGHLRLPRPGAVAPATARAAGDALSRRTATVLAL